jgi:polyhydroxybutyrate depolymerase
MHRITAAAVALAAATSAAHAGCGPDPAPCETAMGTYQISLPEAATGMPAVVFLHGYGGSANGSMSNKGMVELMMARGYAFIAPDGLVDPGDRGGSWSFHPDFPKSRDEMAFLKGVVADAAARFGVDASRVLMTGFSVGGSMTTYLACQDPTAFAAFAPVAGSFWRPHPTECAGPVRLLHTHGWRDSTVPLEGRALGGGRIRQGDVWHGMEIWRETNGCTLMRPDSFSENGVYWRRKWEECSPGSALEFALHPGAHGVPEGWATMALDWFEALPPR